MEKKHVLGGEEERVEASHPICRKPTDKPSRANVHICDGEPVQLNRLLSPAHRASSSALQQTLDVSPDFMGMKSRVKAKEERRKESREGR
jgi:hypothetical protein